MMEVLDVAFVARWVEQVLQKYLQTPQSLVLMLKVPGYAQQSLGIERQESISLVAGWVCTSHANRG